MKSKYIFLLLIFLSLGLNFFSKRILNIDDLLINTFAEQLTNNQIKYALNFIQKWQFLGYVIMSIILLIKVSIITAILDVGCYFFGKEIKYKKLFNIVLKAEFVFLLVIIFKTLWFYIFKQDYALEDLQYFYPLSAINITGYQDLQVCLIYPLQVLNLFELVYWVILAYLLGKELKTNTDNGMLIVASSYGVWLLIWVVVVIFFTLNMS